MDPARQPVIVAVGERIDRPQQVENALEPVALMVAALKACEDDAGVPLLQHITRLSLVGLVSWRYHNPAALLCEQLQIDPAEQVNASMGGETPVRLVHEAAVEIARGTEIVAAVVGGEATHARERARKQGARLAWTPAAAREDAVLFPCTRLAMNTMAKELGASDPASIYPFYATATQASWGETPGEGRTADGALWARYAAVAADNPSAWIRTAPTAETIATVSTDNRMVSWPYPKLMVANPAVNQAGAVIVMSLAMARKFGVAEDRIVHIWGGAHAAEPEDYLMRDRYDYSTAQAAVLDRAVDIAGGDVACIDHMELYSCFPVVPRMALRVLGLDETTTVPTVAGGLTFFGGPLNNYMSHATAAMVRVLRAHTGDIGLLYGQGGYVNKHQTLILSTRPAPKSISLDTSVQLTADATRGPVPPLTPSYNGPASIETYTVTYARDGQPLQGIVICRTPAGERTMARVPVVDAHGIGLLTALDRSAVGVEGVIRRDAFGKPVWGLVGTVAGRRRQFTCVERDGPITIVTINRPEAMNALHPDANAELAEIFDDFATDPAQWIAILTGAGDRAFSAGNDLRETVRRMSRGEPLETPTTGYAGLTARFDLDKPVIAAVNGVAMGGGFEIALACDLIVAADTAIFALPEPRVGLAALAGGLHRLPREIGLKRAMGMILTGRRVDAAEGKALGFVHEVVSPSELMACAKRLATAMLELSPMSLRASKQIVRLGLENANIAEAYNAQESHPALKALFRSVDSREGPLAFAEKRPPIWKGK